MEEMSHVVGTAAISIHYRKPLRVDEVNQMAPTPEVRQRAGRP